MPNSDSRIPIGAHITFETSLRICHRAFENWCARVCSGRKVIEYVGATFRYDKRVVLSKKLFSKRISLNDNELIKIAWIERYRIFFLGI